MQGLTNKIPNSSEEAPTLRAIYDRVGPRNGLAARMFDYLAAGGTAVALSTVFNVIYGRSNHPAITDAFRTWPPPKRSAAPTSPPVPAP